MRRKVLVIPSSEAVPKLGPPPAKAAELVPPDVDEAWRVRDTMLEISGGDREFADRQFEKMRVRKQEKRNGKHRSSGSK